MAFVAAVLVAAAVSSTASAPSEFQLSLMSEYGRAIFTQCRLSVVVVQSHGSSDLWCERIKGPAGARPPLLAHEELSPQETLRLINLFERAGLYNGGHIGVDGTPADGIFETLKVTSQSRTVVLVTSGNKTFEIDSARRELLSQLHGFEQRLRQQPVVKVERWRRDD
jgi:hypothetical protein